MFLVQYHYYQNHGSAGEIRDHSVSVHRTREAAVSWIGNHFCQTIDDAGYQIVEHSDVIKHLDVFQKFDEVTFDCEHYYAISEMGFGETVDLGDDRALKKCKQVNIDVDD